MSFAIFVTNFSSIKCEKTFKIFYQLRGKDITMIHAVADISGLKRIIRTILAQAAAAVVAMTEVKQEADTGGTRGVRSGPRRRQVSIGPLNVVLLPLMQEL